MSPYESIKEAIIIGRLNPGERLKEELLANELNVSRTPIREALLKLESDGLVVSSPRRGFVVRDFTIEETKQIYDIRALLESYAASEGALNRDEADIQQMEKFNKYFEQAVYSSNKNKIQRVKDIQAANMLYHDALFEATHNDYLKYHISKVTVVPLVFRAYYSFSEDHLVQSLEGHRNILKAIKNKEPDRARVAMQEHIFRGRDYVLENEDMIKNKILEGVNNDKYLRSRTSGWVAK